MMRRRSFVRSIFFASTLGMTTTLSLASCDASQLPSSAALETINIGIIEDLDSLDPAKAESAATREVLFNLYDGLVKCDTEGNLRPALASDVQILDGGRVYSFTLRDGVKFHDGSTMGAEDVKYTIERYRDAIGGGSIVSAFREVENVQIVDETRIDVTLKAPNTDFLPFFAIGVVPAHVDDHERTPVGTGPYRFVSRAPLENIVVEKFDDYWDSEGAAHVKRAVYKVIQNTDSVGMDLAGGAIDLAYRMPAAQLTQLDETKFNVYEGTMNIVQSLYVNNAVAPFDDVRVRQALAYAINPQEIMDYVSNGKGVEVGSSMYPAFKKYYLPELAHTYDQNLDRARELLAEAGYEQGFSFKITVDTSHAQHIETAEVLREQLAAIGVNADIKLVEWSSWLSDVYSNRQYEATVIGLDASTMSAPAMLSRFVSDASGNFVNFKSPVYDETYARAHASVDDSEKTALYQECEKILSDECASVYIEDLPSFVVLNKRFEGYVFYPFYAQNIASIRPSGEWA